MNEDIAMSETREHWHLDKRVPIAFLGALALQTCAALVWAGGASARIDAAEAQIGRVQALFERTARLEEQTRVMLAQLDRIEEKLDRGQAGSEKSAR
jgi:hypothetical protein